MPLIAGNLAGHWVAWNSRPALMAEEHFVVAYHTYWEVYSTMMGAEWLVEVVLVLAAAIRP